ALRYRRVSAVLASKDQLYRLFGIRLKQLQSAYGKERITQFVHATTT
ncbi:MAG: hypothetical protein GX180_14070, partial [Enterococcus sp.]|nr:hypothetical protein [Enterococcus sp.]